MKKTANKILSVLLACVMVFTLLPAFAGLPVFAQSVSGGTCSKTMNWNLDENGTLTISGTGEMPRFGYHNDYTPARIDFINAPWKGSNYINEKVKKVVIEEGVESISDFAFDGYYTITEVSLPSTLTEIGRNAFHGCTRLKNIYIPENVETVGYYAFAESGLESVTVANPDVIFDDSVFYLSSKLAEINLPEGVNMFPRGIFTSSAWYKAQPDGLVLLNDILLGYKGTMPDNTELVLPQGVKGIAGCAFANCRALVSVTIPESVTQIGERAFDNCPNLTEINLPGNIQKIGMDAFRGSGWYKAQPDGVVYIGKTVLNYKGTMPEGTELVLADDTEYLADNCFAECTGLASVTIPAGVSTISKAAFFGCTGLTQFTVGSGTTKICKAAFEKCSGLTAVHIPAGITSIGVGVFSECSGLETITVDADNAVYHAEGNCLIHTATGKLVAGCKNSVIPADGSVTAIGAYAFKGCWGLTSLTVPEGIVTIGNDAFAGCSNLPSLTLPDSVAVIGANAFSNCREFTEFTVPEGITIISLGMFYRCTKLKNITIPDSVRAIDGDAFDGCSSLNHINIPYGVKIIGSYAFRGCALHSVVIPDSVTHIGGSAFQHCGGLTEVTLSENLYYIASNTFYNCNLQELVLPDGVGSIDYRAFYSNVNLKSIHFGEHSGYVTVEAFEECRNIESITVDPRNDDYRAEGNCLIYGKHSVVLGCKNSVIPDDGSIERIGLMAFYHCRDLTEIHIPEGVGYIDEKAFTGCVGLTEVTLPESMIRIWYDAFKNCTGLTKMTFPDNVRTIGFESFNGCKNLTEITLTKNVTNNGGAFRECKNLTDVYYYGTEADWSKYLASASYSPGDLQKATVHYLERTPQSEPTATEHGYTAGVYCHTCEEWYAGHEVIHNQLGEITVLQAPTATEPGVYSAVCTVCGSAFTYQHPVGGHVPGEPVAENVIPATYMEEGSYDLVTYCIVCGEVISIEHITEPPLAHTHIPCEEPGYAWINYLTCTQNGTIDEVIYCTLCHAILSETFIAVPATGHNYVSEVTTAPTCVSGGERTYTCVNVWSDGQPCNASYTEAMPALGHTFTSEITTPPTCTEPGVRTYTCIRCPETYTEAEPASGHGSLGYDESGAPSTCIVRGYSMTICIACGEITEYEEFELDPTNHNWGEWTVVTPATYLSEGLEQRTCAWCGGTETRPTPVLVPEETISDPATGIELQLQEGVLPENTVFAVDEEFDGTYFRLLNREVGNVSSTLYNITPTADGEKVQPDGYVLVRLPIPAGYNPDTLSIYYISTETGVTERMDCYIENGYICFQTTHFSVYAIVDASAPTQTETEQPTQPTSGNSDSVSFFARIANWFRSIADFFKNLFKR